MSRFDIFVRHGTCNCSLPARVASPPPFLGRTMRVIPLTTVDDLLRVQTLWNALAGGVPFRQWEWCSTWWRHYGDRKGMLVLTAYDERGQVSGLAPCFIETSAARGRVLQFFGSGETCADYLTLLCRSEHQDAIADAMANWLTENHDAWDLIELSGIVADDGPLLAMQRRLQHSGNELDVEQAMNCWRLALPATWEAYEKQLSKSHRKQVRRSCEQMLQPGKAVLHTVIQGAPSGAEADFHRVFQILVDLHQRRWRRRGGEGVFASPRCLAFHRDVAQQFLAVGKLRLHWLAIDGRPAAAAYNFAGDDAVYGYQSGVEPELLDQGPGALTAIATLQGAIQDGFGAFDFLRGDEPYKAHWRAIPRPCVNLRVVPNRRAARLRYRAWRKARELKRWWQGTSVSGTLGSHISGQPPTAPMDAAHFSGVSAAEAVAPQE